MLTSAVLVGAAASVALAQSSVIPLAAKRFDYNNLPEKADTDNGIRGTQYGYNRCNETTQNQQSNCQTAIINSIDDFCLWGPPEYGEEVGNIEGEMVAWCTKEGHGTRVIPEGALQGVQFMRTPHYVQVVGFIDQQKINILPEDYGGEMDPHGADQRGNPLGGLVFSTAFGANSTTNGTAADGSTYQQVVQWHNFMGGSQFCLKACDPSWENGWAVCEHIFDRLGCIYNAPSNYAAINGTFQSCLGDDQLPPGQYDDANGRRQTYSQPPESLGVISTVDYVPFTPSSSECQTFVSSEIFTAGASLAVSTSSAPSSAATSSAASSGASSAASASSGASSTAAGTASAAGAAATQGGSSGAEKVVAGGVLGGVGALLAAFLV